MAERLMDLSCENTDKALKVIFELSVIDLEEYKPQQQN